MEEAEKREPARGGGEDGAGKGPTGKLIKTVAAFAVTAVLLLVFIVLAANIGGLETTPWQLFKGIFLEYDETVAIIVEIRFPRIFVAILGGAATAVAGVLLQAVMRNPLVDPSIIGISSGASFVAALAVSFLPSLLFLSPLFSFLGGMLAFVIVYALSWKGG